MNITVQESLFVQFSWQCPCISHGSESSNIVITRTVLNGSRGSSVTIVNGVWIERAGFDSQQGKGIFLFVTMSRPALGPNQSPYPKGSGGTIPGIKAAGT